MLHIETYSQFELYLQAEHFETIASKRHFGPLLVTLLIVDLHPTQPGH